MVLVPLAHIEPNKWNPNEVQGEKREQLKKDMDTYGQRENVTISPKDIFYGDADLPNDRYVFCDGQHRWEIARELGWEALEADIEELSEDAAVTRFYRNQATRGEFSPFKEAELFEHWVTDEGLTEEEAAEKFNVSRVYVAGRRAILRTSEAVKALYKEPEKKYMEIAERKIREDTVIIEGAEANPELVQEIEDHIQSELEAVDPRGSLTPGHLRALSSLPNKDQEEIAQSVIGQGLTVRDVEDAVRKRKEKLEKHKRFMEAWETAKVKDCPECGKPPVKFTHTFDDEPILNRFKCADGHNWIFDKTPEELEEEAKAKYSKQIEEIVKNHEHANEEEIKRLFYGSNDITGRARSDRVVDVFLEDHPDIEFKPAPTQSEKISDIRQNPSHVRHLWDTEKINEKIGGWVFTKMTEITEIKEIRVKGLRGDEEVLLKWEPASRHVGVKSDGLIFDVKHTKPIEAEGAQGARNILSTNRFRITIEAKDYKSGHKARIDLPQRTATEEEREAIFRFLEEITDTDLDPWDDPKDSKPTQPPAETQPPEEPEIAEPHQLEEEPEPDYSPGVIECPACHKKVPMTPYCINCKAKLPEPGEAPLEELVEEEPTIPVPDHGRGYQEEPPFGYPASKTPQGELEEHPDDVVEDGEIDQATYTKIDLALRENAHLYEGNDEKFLEPLLNAMRFDAGAIRRVWIDVKERNQLNLDAFTFPEEARMVEVLKDYDNVRRGLYTKNEQGKWVATFQHRYRKVNLVTMDNGRDKWICEKCDDTQETRLGPPGLSGCPIPDGASDAMMSWFTTRSKGLSKLSSQLDSIDEVEQLLAHETRKSGIKPLQRRLHQLKKKPQPAPDTPEIKAEDS